MKRKTGGRAKRFPLSDLNDIEARVEGSKERVQRARKAVVNDLKAGAEGLKARVQREGREAVVNDIRARQARIKPILDVMAQRVGISPRERLAWAVGVVQRPQRELTPGDWENLRLELTAFVWPGKVAMEDMSIPLDHLLPSIEEVQKALTRMGEVIEAAVRRKPVIIGRYGGVQGILWDPESSKWEMDMSGGDTFGWADAAAMRLGDLLLWGKVGSLLK